MILKNAEKPDFMNTRAVRVCQKVVSARVQVHEEPYIYGILRKTGHGVNFLDLAGVNSVKFLMSLGEKHVFLPFKLELSV